MASDDYKAVAGAVAAVVNASWATASAKKKAVDWDWQANDVWTKPNGQLSMKALRLLQEMMRRLGGVHGASITDVVTSISQVQSELTDTTTTALSASQLSAANSNSIDVIRDVAVNAGLPGSGNIP